MIYEDIRNTTDLKSSNTFKIYVYSPTVASKLENKLSEISTEKFNHDIYIPEVVDFNLDSSSQSAEKVAERVLEKCNYINQLIEIINKKA